MSDPGINAANQASRHRLVALAASLDAAALATDIGGGWTVAMALGHLAYWDWHAVACWRRADDGSIPRDWIEPSATIVNDAIEGLLAALPGVAATQLAISAAEELDAVVAALPDATIEALIAAGQGWMADAAEHRDEHIAQIEEGLGRA